MVLQGRLSPEDAHIHWWDTTDEETEIASLLRWSISSNDMAPGLKQQLNLAQKKVRPAKEARKALMINPGESRKSLVNRAKAAVTEEVNLSLLDHLQSLERQG